MFDCRNSSGTIIDPNIHRYSSSIRSIVDRNGGKNAINLMDIYRLEGVTKWIVEHTKYVCFNEMEQTIRQVVSRFIRDLDNKEYDLYVTDVDVFDSSHLMMLMSWDIILKSNIQGIYSSKDPPPKNIPIVIVDDALYSGVHIMSILDCDLSQHESTIHLVLGYSTSNLQLVLKDFSRLNIVTYTGEEVPLYIEIADKPIEEILPNYDYLNSYLPMLYFDHKVASTMSTYRSIYDGYVPIGDNKFVYRKKLVNVSRSIIHTLQYLYSLVI